MSNPTIRAIDRAAAELGGVSDYRLAKVLGVGQQALSKYRTGERQLDDAIAMKVAEIAKLKPEALLAEIQAERSKDDAARAIWLKLARLARAASVIAAISAASLTYTGSGLERGESGVYSAIAAESAAFPGPDNYRTHGWFPVKPMPQSISLGFLVFVLGLATFASALRRGCFSPHARIT